MIFDGRLSAGEMFHLNSISQQLNADPAEIKKAFSQFRVLEQKGYSILFPAWYNYKKLEGREKRANQLWNTDEFLQKTFLWSKGEYTLFVLQKP